MTVALPLGKLLAYIPMYIRRHGIFCLLRNAMRAKMGCAIYKTMGGRHNTRMSLYRYMESASTTLYVYDGDDLENRYLSIDLKILLTAVRW